MNDISTVGYESDELREKAQLLAEQLNFRLEKNAPGCLFVANDKLTLKLPNFSPLFADFNPETLKKRKEEGKKQGLIRACKPKPGLKIIDATAGWGRDAAVLASFGADVLMIERHPVIAALLADALQVRIKANELPLQLSLHHGDALTFLEGLEPNHYPDVIYIDPMHPERTKSALVKKDLQVLQQMIGEDLDALKLIELAITRVKQKVVVKWPQKIKPLLPTGAFIDGKTVRFDLYPAVGLK
ncbi:MAG: class I SAM-dependent methyltransferase [Legionella sp.]|nr:class I SAM-dependent methyltransferase [Legionella sp.]